MEDVGEGASELLVRDLRSKARFSYDAKRPQRKTCLIQEWRIAHGELNGSLQLCRQILRLVDIVRDKVFAGEQAEAAVVFEEFGFWKGVGVLEADVACWAAKEGNASGGVEAEGANEAGERDGEGG